MSTWCRNPVNSSHAKRDFGIDSCLTSCKPAMPESTRPQLPLSQTHQPHVSSTCEFCTHLLWESSAQWRAFAGLLLCKSENSMCIAQESSASDQPLQGPFPLIEKCPTVSNFSFTVEQPHTQIQHHKASHLTIPADSHLSPSFFDLTPLNVMMPDNNNPLSRLSTHCVTFGDHPIHSELGSSFNGTFSFNLDFKCLLNQQLWCFQSNTLFNATQNPEDCGKSTSMKSSLTATSTTSQPLMMSVSTM